MIQYRTQSVGAAVLLGELSAFCDVAAAEGAESAILMFGWDSNLGIDEMWQDIFLPLADVVEYVRAAEKAGTITVGKLDIFVKANGLEITLCHESDLHIEAEGASAQQFLERWESKGFMPYTVLPDVQR